MSQRLLKREKPQGANTCRTSSGSIVSSNEVLMVNILSRLPVKALSRFKCVSKQWNMLISDPCFVSAHQARATQDPNILKMIWVEDDEITLCSIEEKGERIVTLDLIHPNYPDSFPLQYGLRMVGYPCNGLICLAARDETLVCNPASRNTMVIPRGNNRKDNDVQGLGFCPSSNEFKVVRLFGRSECYGCELFTLGQRGGRGRHLQHSPSWRHVGNLPHQIADPSHNRLCYVNGSVHWIIKPVEPPGNSCSSEFILSLDLELEEFKVVSRPEHWARDARYDSKIHIQELGGELSFVVNSGRSREKWDIWVLKDYSKSIWNKEYHIDLEETPLFCSFSVVAICRGQLLLAIEDGTFCYYDLRDNFLDQQLVRDGRYDSQMHLQELGGELAFVINSGRSREKWDIWALKDYSNSIGSKKYHIDLEGTPLFCSFSEVAICRRQLLLAIEDGTFCYYDPREKWDICVLKDYSNSIGSKEYHIDLEETPLFLLFFCGCLMQGAASSCN